MDILIDWQKHNFKINNESISCELKPLQTASVFRLMSINMQSPDGEHVEILIDIFNKHVRNIENLTIGGKPAVPSDLVNVAQLMPVCGEIMGKLTQISSIFAEDEKNSDRQSTS